jgi:hypothetical protein
MLPLYIPRAYYQNLSQDEKYQITISRDHLRAESSVFTRTFNNSRLKESQKQALDLEEIDDAISTRALETLL